MGLPEETLDDVHRTMEQIAELAPDNLTVHSLALKRAARLNMFKEDYKNYKMVNTQEHMDLVAGYAKEMGLAPYYLYRQKNMSGGFENTGWAKKGFENLYNICIMEELCSIMAMGAGGSTKLVSEDRKRIKRYIAPKYPQEYINSAPGLRAGKERMGEFYGLQPAGDQLPDGG